jgi:Kef-type K+ transport system membrane component KefB
MTDQWKGLPYSDRQPQDAPQATIPTPPVSVPEDSPDSAPQKTSSRMGMMYGAMIVAAVGIFMLIRYLGRDSVASAVNGHFGAPGNSPADALSHVLLALFVIIMCARLFGALFKKLHQPEVIGEVIAGIALGPSLLGRISPAASKFILPPTVSPYLYIISSVGVILYMFLVGVELDTQLLRRRTHASVAISHASIITPFLLGSALALWLYPRYATQDVPFSVFALFMGISMSVTAFPVLARILTDSGMHKTRMGTIALACAAVDDVTAWCLFALVVSIAIAKPGRVLLTVGLTILFIAFILKFVQPAMKWLVRKRLRDRRTTQGTMVIVFGALLLSALATDAIGIHALFGAFLLGTMIPHDSALARDVTAKINDLVLVLLLPAFFAYTGLRTQIGLVNGRDQWIACGLIILVASLGKFGGSAAAARISGLSWRQSASLGILMNTRGLMELIVLNVALDLGAITPTLFAMLVLMAIVTTVATTPVLHALKTEEREKEDTNVYDAAEVSPAV